MNSLFLSKAIVLVNLGEFVATNGINGIQGIEVSFTLLSEHSESLLVLVHASLKLLAFSIAH